MKTKHALELLDSMCRDYALAHNAYTRYMQHPGTETGKKALLRHEFYWDRAQMTRTTLGLLLGAKE
jgi:hypothetical protein